MAVITRWSYKRGGRKARFHCTIKYLELEGRRRDWKRGSTYRITLPVIQMVLRFIIYNEQIRVMNI